MYVYMRVCLYVCVCSKYCYGAGRGHLCLYDRSIYNNIYMYILSALYVYMYVRLYIVSQMCQYVHELLQVSWICISYFAR